MSLKLVLLQSPQKWTPPPPPPPPPPQKKKKKKNYKNHSNYFSYNPPKKTPPPPPPPQKIKSKDEIENVYLQRQLGKNSIAFYFSHQFFTRFPWLSFPIWNWKRKMENRRVSSFHINRSSHAIFSRTFFQYSQALYFRSKRCPGKKKTLKTWNPHDNGAFYQVPSSNELNA